MLDIELLLKKDINGIYEQYNANKSKDNPDGKLVERTIEKNYSGFLGKYPQWREDLYSSGKLGLWRGLIDIKVEKLNYESEKSLMLSINSALVWAIRTEANKVIRDVCGSVNSKKRKEALKEISLYEVNDEGCELITTISNDNALVNNVLNEGEICINMDLKNAFKKFKFNDEEIRIINFTIDKLTLDDMADILGVSRYKVCRIRKKIFKALRKELKVIA